MMRRFGREGERKRKRTDVIPSSLLNEFFPGRDKSSDGKAHSSRLYSNTRRATVVANDHSALPAHPSVPLVPAINKDQHLSFPPPHRHNLPHIVVHPSLYYHWRFEAGVGRGAPLLRLLSGADGRAGLVGVEGELVAGGRGGEVLQRVDLDVSMGERSGRRKGEKEEAHRLDELNGREKEERPTARKLDFARDEKPDLVEDVVT